MMKYKYLINKPSPNFQRYAHESPDYFTETCAQVTLSKGLVHKDPKTFYLFLIL